MGQYYTPVIRKGRTDYNIYNSHNYDNGLKLTEHSYIGNNFVDTVLKELYNKPAELAWVGDYAEPDDVSNPEADKFIIAQTGESYRKPVGSNGEFMIDKVVINRSKNEYVDLAEYVKVTPADKWIDVPINPIPLLTAIGNGRGGGDYHGTNMDKIGYWACDTIEVKDAKDLPSGLKNITGDVAFVEG